MSHPAEELVLVQKMDELAIDFLDIDGPAIRKLRSQMRQGLNLCNADCYSNCDSNSSYYEHNKIQLANKDHWQIENFPGMGASGHSSDSSTPAFQPNRSYVQIWRRTPRHLTAHCFETRISHWSRQVIQRAHCQVRRARSQRLRETTERNDTKLNSAGSRA